MEISRHIKVRWTIRGDYTRTATDAWTNGIRVKLPNYRYSTARYDSETKTVLMSNGDMVTTVIEAYDHVEVVPLEDVECEGCGDKFHQNQECPSCGSESWKVI